MALKYPKWKYRVDPIDRVFQSTLVGNAEAEAQMDAGWTDDPYEHGVEVVPLPAELMPDGTVRHRPRAADANGRFAFGPKPRAFGILTAGIGRTLQ